jgi:hypothetical protein
LRAFGFHRALPQIVPAGLSRHPRLSRLRDSRRGLTNRISRHESCPPRCCRPEGPKAQQQELASPRSRELQQHHDRRTLYPFPVSPEGEKARESAVLRSSSDGKWCQKMTRNCPPSICKASKFSFAALRRPPKRPPERFANILLRPNNIEINIALTGDWFHSVSRGVPIRLDPDLCRHHGRYPVKYTIGPATSAMTERADTSHPSNGQKCMLLTQ